MDNDIVSKLELLKSSTEESIRDSRRLDTLLKIFLTIEEIEELSKLRQKQEENMHRIVDIINFAILGSSDKLVEYPDIKLITLELLASRKIVTQTEEAILNIYSAAKSRLM